MSGAAKSEDIRPDIKINILNIVKEALNNIAKHAKASNVKIVLKISSEKIYVLIEDDGKGFDITASSSTNKTKFGLDIMREAEY